LFVHDLQLTSLSQTRSKSTKAHTSYKDRDSELEVLTINDPSVAEISGRESEEGGFVDEESGEGVKDKIQLESIKQKLVKWVLSSPFYGSSSPC
jgi:hypothetical protein